MSSAPRLRTELLTDFAALEALAPAWERLWKASPAPEIFTAFSWSRAAWRARGPRVRLRTPVVYAGNEVAGILPVVDDGGSLRFLGAPWSDYNDFLCADGAPAELLAAALSALLVESPSWGSCVLEDISERSSILRLLPAFQDEHRFRHQLSFRALCPTVLLPAGGRDAVLRSILQKKSLRRHQRKLERLGTVRFRHIEAREAIRRHLPRFFRQHIARRALAGQRSRFCDPETRAFYHALVEELDPALELRFAVVELDHRPVAYHFGFEAGQKFYWYKPSFDVDLWDVSPGESLLKLLFEYVAGRDLREFDFTVGDEPFKSRFANEVRRNYDLHLFAGARKGRIRQAALRAKEEARRWPRTFAAARKAVAMLRRLAGTAAKTLKVHGPAGSARKLLLGAARRLVFQREEVLIFSVDRAAMEASAANTRVKPVRLSALACLAAEDPDLLTLSHLEMARERLKGGDRAYFTSSGRGAPVVIWSGLRGTAVAGANGEPRFEPERPRAMIYELWTRPWSGARQVDPGTIKAALRAVSNGEETAWVQCQQGQITSLRSFEEAGFKLCCRISRVRFLSGITRSRFRWARRQE